MKEMRMDNCALILDDVATAVETNADFDFYTMLDLAKEMAKDYRVDESPNKVQRPLKEGVIVRKDSEIAIVVEDCGESLAVIEYVYYFGKNSESNELVPIESGETATMWDAEDCVVVENV